MHAKKHSSAFAEDGSVRVAVVVVVHVGGPLQIQSSNSMNTWRRAHGPGWSVSPCWWERECVGKVKPLLACVKNDSLWLVICACMRFTSISAFPCLCTWPALWVSPIDLRYSNSQAPPNLLREWARKDCQKFVLRAKGEQCLSSPMRCHVMPCASGCFTVYRCIWLRQWTGVDSNAPMHSCDLGCHAS